MTLAFDDDMWMTFLPLMGVMGPKLALRPLKPGKSKTESWRRGRDTRDRLLEGWTRLSCCWTLNWSVGGRLEWFVGATAVMMYNTSLYQGLKHRVGKSNLCCSPTLLVPKIWQEKKADVTTNLRSQQTVWITNLTKLYSFSYFLLVLHDIYIIFTG